jgi:hypothetical protein
MTPQTDFPLVFQQLKTILQSYPPNLTITADTAEAYSLNSPYNEKWKKSDFLRRSAD